MMSLDEMDGFDDFESEVSSSEENTAIQRTNSQSQKKSVKTGKSLAVNQLAQLLERQAKVQQVLGLSHRPDHHSGS